MAAEQLWTRIYFPDDESISLEEVTPIGPNLYRFERTPIPPMLEERETLYYGDIIEATTSEDNTLHFQRLVERSGLQVIHWGLAKETVESPEFAQFCEEVMSTGGMWERMMGGLVFIHLPQDSELQVDTRIREVIAAVERKASPSEAGV
jgi:hypothetical protein